MLKQSQIDAIAKLLKIDAKALSEAIKDADEKDIVIPDGLMVLTETELEGVKNTEYKKGKDTGSEMIVKEAKEKYGLDFNGKTIDKLIEAHKAHVLKEASIEPNKQIEELQKKLENVTNTATDLEKKLGEKDKEISGIHIKSEVVAVIPDNVTLPKEKVFTLMKADGYVFEKREGATVVIKDGAVLEDKLSKPLAIKDVAAKYAEENNLLGKEVKKPAGRGGKDDPGKTVYAKLSEIKKEFEEAGKNTQGDEFRQAVMAARQNNPEFDLSA